jgi:hypothetical protein
LIGAKANLITDHTMNSPRVLVLVIMTITLLTNDVVVPTQRLLRAYCPPTLDVCKEIERKKMIVVAQQLAEAIIEDEENKRMKEYVRAANAKRDALEHEMRISNMMETKIQKQTISMRAEEEKQRSFKQFMRQQRGMNDIDKIHDSVAQSNKHSDWDMMVNLKQNKEEIDKFHQEHHDAMIRHKEWRQRKQAYQLQLLQQDTSSVKDEVEEQSSPIRWRPKGATETDKLLSTRGRWGRGHILKPHIEAL